MFLVGKAFRPLSRTIFFAIRFSPRKRESVQIFFFLLSTFPSGARRKKKKGIVRRKRKTNTHTVYRRHPSRSLGGPLTSVPRTYTHCSIHKKASFCSFLFSLRRTHNLSPPTCSVVYWHVLLFSLPSLLPSPKNILLHISKNREFFEKASL